MVAPALRASATLALRGSLTSSSESADQPAGQASVSACPGFNF